MNTFKNFLIALLTGLLVLTLTTQPSIGASKKYDAEKLLEYAACLNGNMNWEIGVMQANLGNGSFNPSTNIQKCRLIKP